MVTAVNKIFDSIKRGWDSPFHNSPSFARECDDEAPTKERPIAAHVNRLHMRSGSCSVTGNYRQLNEDRCFTDDENHLLLIVDGMGGHRGGADASRIIVDTLPRFFREKVSEPSPEKLLGAAEEAIRASRDEIVHFAHTHPGFESMGATLVLGAVADDKLTMASVGDCRAYQLHGDKLTPLTTDQTFVQAMVEAGQLSRDEARTHPWRHVVLNAVGVREMEEPIETVTAPLAGGDRVLLATDGLTDVVDDAAIAKVLKRCRSPQAAAEELVQLALENDSKDNVSCIVADFE